MEEKLGNLPSSYQEDIKKAIAILKENGAKEVFIFGSIANGKFNKNSDIDIAVKGINEEKFYKVASMLMFELENEFDLIDLDDKENRFSQMLLNVGGLLKIGWINKRIYRHAYSFELNWEKMKPLVEDVHMVWQNLKLSLENYV